MALVIPATQAGQEVSIRPFARGLSDLTAIASNKAEPRRLYVVEQVGRIRYFVNGKLGGTFLDIRDRVVSAGERGLLSVAFHPDYGRNHRFYVDYTDRSGDTRVVRYRSNGRTGIASSARPLLYVKDFAVNHNGGQLQFGPDNMLWAGTGDGGGGGDTAGNGQNKHALLGKLLRLDVSGASGYTIPTDNPGNADTSFAPQVWSYGLRNPWRFSFDRQTGDLYIADVGQNRYEEVDVAPTAVQRGRGVNFGWNIMEGMHCYPNDPCTAVGQLPVVEYPHFGGTCSITGGYVYGGSALPALVGNYFYADFCDGSVYGIRYPGSTNPVNWTSLLSPGPNISSFGQDARGELYILQLDGAVWRIIPRP